MDKDRTFLERLPADSDAPDLSRRKFLTGAVAGGATGLAIAAGTGVAVWKIVDAEALAAQQAAQEAADAEIARLQGLVDLYEDLEKIGLDAILMTGMKAVALPLGAVEVGARTLKSGLDWAEDALLSLKEALPTAQESLLWLEEQVSAVADGIANVETALGRALDQVADHPIAEALQDFSNLILDNLPFGLGDKFREVLDSLVGFVTQVDDLVAGINTRLLEPLRENWFAAQEGQGLAAGLIDPLVEHILDPLEAHLVNLSVMADNWQNDLMAPTQQALEQRAEIRAEIARYKQEHGLG